MGPLDDLAILRSRLSVHEDAARAQPWGEERPWRASTHVRQEADLIVIDLHDLGAKLARTVLTEVASASTTLQTGAIGVITGRGRRSIGPGVLGAVTRDALREAAAAHGGSVRPMGPARWVWVWAPERAPAVATGALGWGFWLLIAFFVLAAAVVFWAQVR